MAALAEGGQDHGALVQQILETQKELEDVNKRQQHKTAIEIVSFTHLSAHSVFICWADNIFNLFKFD